MVIQKFVILNENDFYQILKAVRSKPARHLRVRAGVPYYAGAGAKRRPRVYIPSHWKNKVKEMVARLKEIAPEFPEEAEVTARHYIKNFLVPIATHAQMYRKGMIPREKYREFLERKEKEFTDLQQRIEESARAKKFEPYTQNHERIYRLPERVLQV